MREVKLTVEEAEMIDIWTDNVVEDFKQEKNKRSWAKADLEEIRLAVLIRAKMRNTFPEIGKSLDELDEKINQLFNKGKGKK